MTGSSSGCNSYATQNSHDFEKKKTELSLNMERVLNVNEIWYSYRYNDFCIQFLFHNYEITWLYYMVCDVHS